MIITHKGVQSNDSGMFRVNAAVPVEVNDDIQEISLIGIATFINEKQFNVKNIYGNFVFDVNTDKVQFLSHTKK